MPGSHHRVIRSVLPFTTFLFCFGAAIPDGAAANPLPDCAVLVHVHSWSPSFCQNNPIVACSQVVQYSEIEGDVEFDLFLDNRYGFVEPFAQMSMTVHWPQAWQLRAYEDCVGGEVSIASGNHMANLRIDYDSPVDPGSWLLLGRFRMQVSGFGGLDFSNVAFDGQFYGAVGPGLAGVDCTYSYLSCGDLMPPCGGFFDTEALELHVPQEGTTSVSFDVWTSWNGGFPCPVEFLETADWIDLDLAWDEYHFYAVMTVTANAAGLEPGVYPTIIRAVSQVVTCLPVTVYVEPSSSAPEPDPMRTTISWGKIKRSYR